MNNKYEPLCEYLKTQSREQVPMSFKDIERLIRAKLPPSARKHRPWWSNHPGNSVVTKAWLDAGYRSEQVDMQRQRLVFCRQPAENEIRDSGASSYSGASFYGCMKDMIVVADDCDLTAPANPDWHRGQDR